MSDATTTPDVTITPSGVADGVSELRERVQRRSRTVPAPRKPRDEDRATAAGTIVGESTDEVVGERNDETSSPGTSKAAGSTPSASAPRPARRAPQHEGPQQQRPATRPDEPVINLAIRVRRSLDDRLSDLIHDLRREGVRTSKVELLELLLWELPPAPTPELRRRLGEFRDKAPKEARL